MRRLNAALLALTILLLLTGCAPSITATGQPQPSSASLPASTGRILGERLESGRGYRLDEDGLMVVHLRGTDLEMRAQAQALLAEELAAFRATVRDQPELQPYLGGCSNIAAFGPASADRTLWHGRNFDFRGQGVLDVYRVVYIIEPEGGIPYVAVSWSGPYPWNYKGVHTAMNARGLSLGYMLSEAPGETIDDAPVLWELYARVMASATTIDEAVDILKAGPRRGAANLLIADGNVPDAIVVEMTSRDIAVRPAAAGTVYATNHFVSPELFKAEYADRNSEARFQRLKELAGAGAFDLLRTAGALRDRVDPRTGANSLYGDVIGNPLNMLSVVFHPGDLTFWVANGPAPSSARAFVGFSLKNELAGTQAQTNLPAVPADPSLDAAPLGDQ